MFFNLNNKWSDYKWLLQLFCLLTQNTLVRKSSFVFQKRLNFLKNDSLSDNIAFFVAKSQTLQDESNLKGEKDFLNRCILR